MAHYLVEYVFTPDKRHLPVRPAHRDYLTDLQNTGRLVLSGPLGDDTGGLLVLRADSETEVRQLLEADPYHRAEALDEVRIRQWTPLFGYLAEHLEDR
ncbi:YciI family protein [Kitasatospora sp. NPDC089797]|uniref:YciI family protein n=1 Tax=Kitasatospora sp. NPDC089797 TaxID=3155298 RepID=UPI003432F037